MDNDNAFNARVNKEKDKVEVEEAESESAEAEEQLSRSALLDEQKIQQNTNTKKLEEEISKSFDVDTTCGLWFIKGKYLQRYANETALAIIFGITSCVMAMTYAYYNGTLTTMEKRFKISSRLSGIIVVGSEISGLIAALIVGYYGGTAHRPRWMGIGMIIMVGFCLLSALPHMLYGAGKEALALTLEYGINELNNSNVQQTNSLCTENSAACDQQESSDWKPPFILFFAQFISGIGSTLFYMLGFTYLDDNVALKKAPAMLSSSTFLRMLGPACGYTLSSICLRLYIAPTLTPLIDNKDNRWLGAWWLGWLIIAANILLFGIFFSLFPKELPSAKQRRLQATKQQEDVAAKPSLQDFKKSVKRLLRNKVYVYNNLGSILYCFGYNVYWLYTPKYIEVQFLQSAATSSMVTGSVAFAFSAAGVLLSGFLLSKFKPSGRAMATWNNIVNMITVLGCLSYVFIGCDGSDRLSNSMVKQNNVNSEAAKCLANCQCDYVQYSPVCGEDNVTYLSPCHAGCSSERLDEHERKIFENCACISSLTQALNATLSSTYNGTATDGVCSVNCFPQFLTFLIVMCTLKFLGAAAMSTNLLIALRCIDAKDKTFSFGIGWLLFGIFTCIPSPIFFGWLLDSVCIVWGKTCTGQGNCWLYDTKALRYKMNLVATVFILIGSIFTFGVWYYIGDLDMFDTKETVAKKTESESKSNEDDDDDDDDADETKTIAIA